MKESPSQDLSPSSFDGNNKNETKMLELQSHLADVFRTKIMRACVYDLVNNRFKIVNQAILAWSF